MLPLSAEALALLASIDAGDHSALPILADALEEAGDRRHIGIRYAVADGRFPAAVNERTGWQWEPINPRGPSYPHWISRPMFDRLPPLDAPGRKGALSMIYATRSAAYLALAKALIEEE